MWAGQFVSEDIRVVEINSTYYFKQASKNMLIGLGLGAGAGLVSASALLIKSQDKDFIQFRSILSIGMGIAGFINFIVGVNQIGKAGICLDEERKISLTTSKSGIGIAINF